MSKNKKFQMPGNIRNKLMGAVAMLLVSSILMVSTTYAWFTLSTAPEVTGITTSVGANGNLEMALLNTDTYGNLSKITSAVGDSSAATNDVTVSNITWGNLVDLSNDSYGLGSIKLMPARLNVANGETKITTVANLLKTATYGADGRVKDVGGMTFTSGTYNGTWTYDSTALTYGVRAIGANDNLTKQQAGLMVAKAGISSSLSAAKSTIQSALSTNGHDLASAVTTIAMNSGEVTLTEAQQTAISNMVNAAGTALEKIDTAYMYVLLALATQIEDSTAFETAKGAIMEASDYAAAKAAVPSVSTTGIDAAVTALNEQKGFVSAAQTSIGSEDYKTALGKLVDTELVTVNGYENKSDDGDEVVGEPDLMVSGNINSTFLNKVISDGGLKVQMPTGSGVFAYIGSVVGNYSAATLVDIDYKGLKLDNMNATLVTNATPDDTLSTVLAGIITVTSGSGATALSDTYGYALDFAFRTNAANSKLQLQTDGVQRVYSDSTSEVTQGAGSTMTFTSAEGANLTDDAVKGLMGAIRVAFIDPADGNIYGIASLDNIGVTADGVKGDLTLKGYSVNEKGVMTLTGKTDDDTKDDIMELQQNVATKLTVVVWLDGDYVDNGNVANAAQSIVGSMNLQFSSSATLVPMQNTALKNMEASPATP